MTSFSFFEYFDAFELDVNVVNFVCYGKTRMESELRDHYPSNMCFVRMMYAILRVLGEKRHQEYQYLYLFDITLLWEFPLFTDTFLAQTRQA